VDALIQNPYPLNLNPGWNFISTPGVPTPGNEIFAIFSHVDTKGHSIWAYDPTWSATEGWRMVGMYDVMQMYTGYWIYSASPVTVFIPISTVMPTEAQPSPSVKSLYPGWNAIGSFGMYQKSAQDALRVAEKDWVVALGFNSMEQQYDPSIINGGYAEHADTRLMYPGSGYWLYMQNPGNLF
jgi:hypothetical protein